MRSNNSTPIAGASGTVSQSRKSPQGDQGFNAKDDHRTSSRGSGNGGQGRGVQNDVRNQRGGGSGSNRAPGGRGGRSRGGRGGMGGQGSFNRFAGNFANRSKTPLKFDEDYDFESANVKVIYLSILKG